MNVYSTYRRFMDDMDKMCDKNPVRFLDKQIIKYDRENNLGNPSITDKQKSYLIKFRTWTYTGNKCSSVAKDIPLLRAPYVIRTNQIHGYMYDLHVNNNIYIPFELKDITKQLGKLGNSQCHPKNPDAILSWMLAPSITILTKNRVPNWLLPCTCGTQRCHCNTRCRPDILCLRGLPYQNDRHVDIGPNLTIQFIEFTYCNDTFPP